MPDDAVALRARLDRARRRVADAPPFSPDWDAATALIEDLERRLAATSEASREPVSQERLPASVG